MTRADNLRGAGFMVISMAAFVVNDSLMKSLAGELPLFQAIFLRGVFATILVGGFALARGVARPSVLARADRKLAVLRAGAEIGATTCFLTALFNMPFANAMAILQAAPLALTFIGAVFLKEAVGWRRWSAVGVGFLGVLLIVRPGTEGFNSATLWALASVSFICIRDLVTRRLSRETPSLFITLMTAVAITSVGGIVTATTAWQPATPAVVGMLALAACFLFVGYYSSVLTMRVGEIGFVSPFRYSILIWALLIGWIVFDEVPRGLTLVGAAMVVGAGLYTFFRERGRV
jgi:drug/metabolite transporter (DMT)-like permease